MLIIHVLQHRKISDTILNTEKHQLCDFLIFNITSKLWKSQETSRNTANTAGAEPAQNCGVNSRPQKKPPETSPLSILNNTVRLLWTPPGFWDPLFVGICWKVDSPHRRWAKPSPLLGIKEHCMPRQHQHRGSLFPQAVALMNSYQSQRQENIYAITLHLICIFVHLDTCYL